MSVQIPNELFIAICRYHVFQDDTSATMQRQIQDGLRVKLNALLRRYEFTRYKTGLTDRERREALLEYLKCDDIYEGHYNSEYLKRDDVYDGHDD